MFFFGSFPCSVKKNMLPVCWPPLQRRVKRCLGDMMLGVIGDNNKYSSFDVNVTTSIPVQDILQKKHVHGFLVGLK